MTELQSEIIKSITDNSKAEEISVTYVFNSNNKMALKAIRTLQSSNLIRIFKDPHEEVVQYFCAVFILNAYKFREAGWIEYRIIDQSMTIR